MLDVDVSLCRTQQQLRLGQVTSPSCCKERSADCALIARLALKETAGTLSAERCWTGYPTHDPFLGLLGHQVTILTAAAAASSSLDPPPHQMVH